MLVAASAVPLEPVAVFFYKTGDVEHKKKGGVSALCTQGLYDQYTQSDIRNHGLLK